MTHFESGFEPELHAARSAKGPSITCQTVSAEGITARLRKGASAADLPKDILVIDTGCPLPPDESRRAVEDQESLDALYRDTIRRGIIDHHAIDATVTLADGIQRRSSTGMIILAPELIREQIESRGVREITAHQDSDLDSLSACFLAASIKQHGSLPQMAKRLAEHVDLVDFGLLRVSSDEYGKTLAGTLAALKKVHDEETREQLRTQVWSHPSLSREEKTEASNGILAERQQQLTEDVFHLFNSCERLSLRDEFSLLNVSEALPLLRPELQSQIARGQSLLKNDLDTFERELRTALIGSGRVLDHTKTYREVPVIIFRNTELHPLAVTNLSYLRFPPEAVIGVFAGSERLGGGDAYNVGIKPETAQAIFSLDFLASSFSKREKDLRAPIITELTERESKGEISDEQRRTLQTYQTLRPGFEHLEIGDPTVCVAGGSLIAASNSSLLKWDDFYTVISEQLTFKRD
jgi:hypothetical protein